MARQMKDSGIEWIGEIAEDHPLIKLKHVCQILDQYRSPVTADQRSQAGEVLYDYYGASGAIDKIDGYTIDDHVMLIGEDGANLRLRNLPLMYEVNGKAWINNHAHILKPNDGTDFYYLFYALEALDINPYITGSAQPKLSQENLKNILIPMPSLAVQRRIAVVIREKSAKIDAVIERTKATIEEYKKLKQAVITEAVTKGVRGARKMKDSGIEWIGEIPEEWEIVKMKHLGKCRNGLTYSPENVCGDEGTLVLRSSNIQDGKLCFGDNVYVDCQVKDELMVKKGDILICSRNGSRALIGKNALIPDDIDASFGAFMMIFRCECPEYVHLVLNSAVFSYYLGTFLTATINQLTADNFNNMQIVYCPDEAEQREIIEFLKTRCASIDALIAKKTALLTELETYKKSLIYEYVTGKKEVL